MADPKNPDPSMAEILASIRDILNEDEKAEPDEPLDLTEAMLVSPPAAPAPATPVQDPAPATPAVPVAPGPQAQAVVADRTAPVSRGGGTTIEDVVREEMRPLLQAWLDQHLPGMVERMVKAEIGKMLDRQPD